MGDLVLHILFQAQIANEKKQFSIEDSLQNICDKLIKRHPHVFNEQKKKSSNWEFEKQREKSGHDSSCKRGVCPVVHGPRPNLAFLQHSVSLMSRTMAPG